MRMHWMALIGLWACTASVTASASPGGPPGAPMDRATREQMLQRVHTAFIVELGQILDLDTAGTLKLAERLKQFDDRRIKLRLETWEGMEALKGTGRTDAVSVARKVAQTRVEIAQLDQAELEELLKGLPSDKAAKAAAFFVEYPRRIEHMAREIHRDRTMNGPKPGGAGD